MRLLINTLWVSTGLVCPRVYELVVACEQEPEHRRTTDWTKPDRWVATGAKNAGHFADFGFDLVQKVAEFDDANR